MLFNSIDFFLFLPLVFLGYWYVFGKTLRAQNLFVVVASYVFYGWWDWRYLLLLFFSSFADYWIALLIDSSEDAKKRKRGLWLSIVFNLGILCTFKYFNFFIDSFADLLRMIGFTPHMTTLRIMLPVGISFYTFQSLGYTIEVYRKEFKPVRDPMAYLAFVSFFPHMVAGPIMRANDLLPQFLQVRRFNSAKARDGARQALWGLVKKVAIADTCAPIVDQIFAGDPSTTPGITLLFGAFLFAFQIYGDFSGYSDIAIGVAKILGVDLMRNFNKPYFSRSIGEFWRRWHISLSTWFRDFVYIPLGGGRHGMAKRIRNLIITFTVSGFWHGANWTFVAWGALHGAYYVPEVLGGKKQPTGTARLREIPRMILVFFVVVLAWVFFRSASIGDAMAFLLYSGMNIGLHPGAVLLHAFSVPMALILGLLVVEWLTRERDHPLAGTSLPRAGRWAMYLLLVLVVLVAMDVDRPNEFIYFQF